MIATHFGGHDRPAGSGSVTFTARYEARGAGPLLLLIAGGNSDAVVFERLAAALAPHYRVVSYDPRGNSRHLLDGPPVDQRILMTVGSPQRRRTRAPGA